MPLAWPEWLTPRAWKPDGEGAAPPGGMMAPAPALPASGPPEPRGGRFLRCLAIVLGHEGGFVDDPADPGGATNLGITAGTLADWRGRPVTAAEVRALSRDEALAIYRARYWAKLRCDDLPVGIDLMVFDFGVNAGPPAAARMLQRAVYVEPDGAVGPATLAAVRAAEAGPAIDRMARLREAHYRALPTFGRFGRGWLRRTEDVRVAARRMVDG